jgi:hypothetical protein
MLLLDLREEHDVTDDLVVVLDQVGEPEGELGDFAGSGVGMSLLPASVVSRRLLRPSTDVARGGIFCHIGRVSCGQVQAKHHPSNQTAGISSRAARNTSMSPVVVKKKGETRTNPGR